MSYLNERPGMTAGIIGAMVVGALSIGFSLWSGRAWTADMMRAEFERQPEVRATAQALDRYYPQDYQRLLERLAAAANRRSGNARTEGFTAVRQFMLSKVQAVTSAPDADLVALADASSEFVRVLKRSNRAACTQFVMSGPSPGTRLSPEVMERLNAMNVLQLRAAHNGEGPNRVVRGEISDEDALAWMERLRTIDPATARRVEEDSMTRASPEEQCAGGAAIYQAVAELPDRQSAAVMATLIREGAAAR
jgi:hypothetical protein